MTKLIIASDHGGYNLKKEIIKHLIEQVTGSVRWRETMNYMHSHGVTDIYELGAGKVLSGIVKRGYKDINTTSA